MSRSQQRATRIGRRPWLIAASAGVVAAGIWGGRRWLHGGAETPAAAGALAGLSAGDTLDRWTVVRVDALHLGAVPVVLATPSGERYQVDVLARDPQGPQGVANTERLSLFVVNSPVGRGDDGRRQTDETQGLGAMVLAQALVERKIEAPIGLLTLRERQQQHPAGAFARPLA